MGKRAGEQRATGDGKLGGELRGLIGRYLAVRGAERASPRTLEGYRDYLARFAAWVETERPLLDALVALEPQTLADYALHLAVLETRTGRRLAPGSRLNQLTALRSFFSWLEREGLLLLNPARRLPLPKVPHPLPRGVLSLREASKLLAAADGKTAAGLRDRALLELLYSTGLRNSEALRLRDEDLDLAAGFVTVREGKGGEGRVVPLGRVAQRWIERYLKEGRPALQPLGAAGPGGLLFPSLRGRPLGRHGLSAIVKRTGQRARLRFRIGAHALRHTFATHLLRGGADIRHVQALLGHKRLSSTQIYTHVALRDLKRVHARCHPRERKRS